MKADVLLELMDEMMEYGWDARQSNEVPPTFFILTESEDGRPNADVIICPWANKYEQAAYVAAIATVMEEMTAEGRPPLGVLLVTDAWMRRLKVDQPFDGVPPSESVDGVECLIVSAWDADGKIYIRERQYRTTDDGTLEQLPEEKESIDGPIDHAVSPNFQPIIDVLVGPHG